MNLTYSPSGNDGTLLGYSERSGDRYLLILGFVLLGYAVLSRGFAYWGVPPVFVGEVVLALGIVELARSRTLGTLVAHPVGALLGTLLLLTTVRTFLDFGMYGLDAIRDAMQLVYGLFAFVVAALLVARAERLKQLLSAYRTYAIILLSTIWIVYLVYKTFEQSIPFLPWADTARVFEAKGGDIMVQLAGVTTFLVVGLMRHRPLLLFALAANAGIVMVSNRGGMVAFFIAVVVGVLLRPPDARTGKLVYAFGLFLVIGLIVGPLLPIHGGTREISIEQIWTNVESVIGQSDSGSLEGTKKWRLEWWDQIYDYTVRGEYFWTGKGFGVNLAEDDGFLVDPSLRSPHNGHMTVLARLGVPGALLWVLLQIGWFATLMRAWWNAREQSDHKWMAVFAVAVSLAIAMHINAAFDVYFEGPMGGIWFWTVFGAGFGAALIYRLHPEILDDDNVHTATDNPFGPAADADVIPPKRNVTWGWPTPAHSPGA
ncbi:MAG: O-antigen ligase family protein [Rubricoccaceae bacterium]|nr:O-antigen ligase family protein [Rubricoccaceae bacterium]